MCFLEKVNTNTNVNRHFEMQALCGCVCVCVFVRAVCASELIRENGGVFLTAGTLRVLHPTVSLCKPFKSSHAYAAAAFNQNHS